MSQVILHLGERTALTLGEKSGGQVGAVGGEPLQGHSEVGALSGAGGGGVLKVSS